MIKGLFSVLLLQSLGTNIVVTETTFLNKNIYLTLTLINSHNNLRLRYMISVITSSKRERMLVWLEIKL
ncbi:hypothetical protein GCM10028868_10980 [Virgibacillus kimchii]